MEMQDIIFKNHTHTYTHSYEDYSAMRKQEIMVCVIIQMDL